MREETKLWEECGGQKVDDKGVGDGIVIGASSGVEDVVMRGP